jgi:hypothetical protein
MNHQIVSKQIVCNKIITPDGTVLQSRNRHDYLLHVDANGYTYMVDGGLDYLRRAVVDEAPCTEASVYLDDEFDEIRKAFAWGSYGKGGKEKLHYIPLKDMEDEHLAACLREGQGAYWVQKLMTKEQHYRKHNGS